MKLIKVNVIGSQSAKAVLGRLAHVARLGSVTLLVHLHAEFGGDDYLFAAAAQRLSQVLFALRAAVYISRIEEVDPGVKRGMHHLGGGIGVQAPAKVVAPQTNHGNLQRADPALFHVPFLHLPDLLMDAASFTAD